MGLIYFSGTDSQAPDKVKAYAWWLRAVADGDRVSEGSKWQLQRVHKVSWLVIGRSKRIPASTKLCARSSITGKVSS